MDDWPIAALVGYVEQCLSAYPAPGSGRVRAVPDERTIRYYGTIGLLDKPIAMRGRTALYGRKHVAQIIAIKRLQTDGRTLAEIQALWPRLDDQTLSRMSGVDFPPNLAPREQFWKEAPAVAAQPEPEPARVATLQSPVSRPPTEPPANVELRIELAPDVTLLLAVPDLGISISKADIGAIRAAAATLVAELARRQLTMNAREEKT